VLSVRMINEVYIMFVNPLFTMLGKHAVKGNC
jgi:hypothetical protein